LLQECPRQLLFHGYTQNLDQLLRVIDHSENPGKDGFNLAVMLKHIHTHEEESNK